MSRPEQVYKALRQWLDGPSGLEEAICRTVQGGLFPEQDVLFAIAHLRESLTIEIINRWWKRAGDDYDFGPDADSDPDSESESASESKSDPDHVPGRPPLKILCLHAGNLPMVGLQDVVAVLLSGNRYFGKFSRNDPWLIASFVDVCRERGLPEVCGCSTELGSFSGLRADAVLFTGSDKSVPVVMGELLRLKAVNRHPQTRYLIRTAQLSVAFVRKQQSAGELLEAVTRYDGRGCRSVGVVVSPYSLDDYAEALRLAESGGNEKDHVPGPGAESDKKGSVPEPGAGSDENDHVPEPDAGPTSGIMNGPKKYLYAYAVAAGLPTLQLFDGRFLFIESDDTGFMREGVVLWIRGGLEELEVVRKRLSGRIQSVFTDKSVIAGAAGVAGEAGEAFDTEVAGESDVAEVTGESEVAGAADEADVAEVAGESEATGDSDKAEMADHDDFESLNKAQRPEFDWCPDGVDTLQWLKARTTRAG